ncbi:MAG: superinfection exclusion B family protein [Cyclobacteriaceae bacterium]|nr:superinfection exclusion B family protein [Cyclobacteriaceae bacterium]
MEKFLEKLFDINKIPTKLIIVILLSSALILFVPQQFLTKLNLDGFLHDYGKFIGISFIVSSGFTLIALWTYVTRLISRRRLSKKIKESIIKDINYLDFHEKALLREFFINGKHTLQLPFDNDTVVGLVNKHIIYQASSTGFTYLHGAYFPYTISDIANKHLTNKILELPENPTEEEKRKILDSRPNWAKERSRMDDLFNSRW